MAWRAVATVWFALLGEHSVVAKQPVHFPVWNAVTAWKVPIHRHLACLLSNPAPLSGQLKGTSMSSNNKRIARTAVVATAIGVAALGLTIPAPVHAEPGCAQYSADGRLELKESSGTWVTFDAHGTEFGGSNNASIFYTDGDIVPAGAGGRIEGRAVTITVEAGEAGKYKKSYTGTVGDDGIARGTVRTEADLGPVTPDGPVTLDGEWQAGTPLKCATPAPQPEPSGPNPNPNPVPDQQKSEITLRYETLTFPFPGITAFVGITNNENKPPAGCTYSDGVTPLRPFTVTGSAESRIDIAGLPTGTVFHVTVTCDNGLTHSEDKTF
jgi:hypothetical protein